MADIKNAVFDSKGLSQQHSLDNRIQQFCKANLADIYQPFDSSSIFRMVGSLFGGIPLVRVFQDLNVNSIQKLISRLSFKELIREDIFDKENKQYLKGSNGFINFDKRIFLLLSLQESSVESLINKLSFPNSENDDDLLSDDLNNEEESISTHITIYYDNNVDKQWLEDLFKEIERIALEDSTIKVKKNSINFLCFDQGFRLKNVKIKRPFNGDLELNYGADFLKINDHLVKFLDSNETGLAILFGNPGGGKCLGKGTKVLMFNGTNKKVESIVTGDLLMGPDSKPRKVLSVANGQEELFKITPTKGNPYIVNRSHILSLKMSGKSYNKRIVNISIDEYLKQAKSFKDRAKGWRTGIEFKYQSVPLDPYFLGIWLGDGTASYSSITTMDQEVVDYCKNLVEKMGMLLNKRKDNHSGKASTYCLVSKARVAKGLPREHNPIMMALRSLDLLDNKHIPLSYKVNDREVRMELLAGLLDSDGHYELGGFEITTVLPNLADDILFLARSLGFAAYVKQRQTKWKAKGYSGDCTSYRIYISGDLSIVPTKILRKKAAKRKQIKNVLVSGIKVESIGDGEYFGFELDRDGLFLLDDFTVTHNTSYIRHLLSVLNKKVIYIPPHLVNRVAEPDFLSFLLRQNDFVLVIEDAEEIITNRKDTGNTAGVSNLLNLSDGILGDCIRVKIVVTFNSEISNIDPALLRKGRLKIQHEFKKLDVLQANKLFKHLNIDFETKEPMNLSDIYGFNTDNYRKEKERVRIGFGK